MPQQDNSFNWASPALFQAIVEQVQEAIIVVDCDETIQVWNAGAQALFGHSTDEMQGRNLDAIVPERLRQAHSNGFRKAVASGHTKYGGQVMTTRSMHKDGSKLYVDLSFVLLRDAAATVVGVCAVARDATARYLAEQASRAAAQP